VFRERIIIISGLAEARKTKPIYPPGIKPNFNSPPAPPTDKATVKARQEVSCGTELPEKLVFQVKRQVY
jgi:hypothetical protein